ncbi:GNAT family N-acetyltransferase [Bauldia sp.]|uniref:GNAT family N-acetyltransferase n=1 Tax=Bauldia sp. TaxID=2575872 RepID=UPI003BAA0FFA
MDFPDRIETPRLALRKLREDDADAIFHGYAADAEVSRLMTWLPHQTLADTKEYLRGALDRWSDGSEYSYAIEWLDEPSALLGAISLRPRAAAVSFGYVLKRSVWNQGIGSEALTTLVDLSLARPNVFRAEAFCDVDNLASARVMEKAGMRFEGILRRYIVHPGISPEPRDCRMYAKVR